MARLCSTRCVVAHRKTSASVRSVNVDVVGPKNVTVVVVALARFSCVASDVISHKFAQIAIFAPKGKTLINKPGFAVRSLRRPLGESRDEFFKQLVKHENKDIFKMVDRGIKSLTNGHVVFWIADARCYSLLFPDVIDLSQRESMLWDAVFSA